MIVIITLMDVLRYKTSPVKTLLEPDIITNNLIETDKISDPRYVMSACTAWLRHNCKKNLYDLQQNLIDLGLKTKIFAEKYNPQEYTVCVPGNNDLSLKLYYVANFVSNPAALVKIKQSLDDMLKLKHTGYSCSEKYSTKISYLKHPSIEDLNEQDNIYVQLQWAAVKFYVEHVIVNPDEMLEKDLNNQTSEVTCTSIIYKEKKRERVYAYINDRGEYISQFGILETTSEDGSTTSRLVIYLPAYLHEPSGLNN